MRFIDHSPDLTRVWESESIDLDSGDAASTYAGLVSVDRVP